jgi:membrane protease YdiL (CAAX protease family)
VAWVVILGIVGVEAFGGHFVPASAQTAARDERMGLLVMRMQARYLVGAQATFHPPGMYEQAKLLNTGPVGQRLRFVVLAGELRGPQEAHRQLRKLDVALAKNGRTYTPRQADTRNLLERLYRDYEVLRFDAPSLSQKDREDRDGRDRLQDDLGWFGELALAPDGRPYAERVVLPAAGAAAANVLAEKALPDPQARAQALAPALRTLWTNLGMFGSVCLLGVAGLAGLITFIVLMVKGYVRGRFACGASPGGIYAETFALWLILFTGLPLLVPLLPPEAPRLLLSGAAALVSLVALGWPRVRGIPWRQVRADIGLTAGDRPALEPLCGLAAYGISLPLLAVGFLATLFLTMLERALTGGAGDSGFEPLTGPSHPIVLFLAHGDVWAKVQVFLLGCVVAPVVEETMFRGVLYRNLREATGRLGRGWSFFFSATLVSFLFAAVHPQGLVAIPVLMSLAYAFSIAREWRGTLVPGMVAHAVNNGAVMAFAMLALGD